MASIKKGSPNRKRAVCAHGGPWAGKWFDTRVPDGDRTMVIRLGEFNGRYKMNHGFSHTATWEQAE